MRSKSYCSPGARVPAIRQRAALFLLLTAGLLGGAPYALAGGGDAPQWMHALTGTSLPAYDAKADAVLLYSETNVTVLSADKIRTQVREAYKILRPEGREHGFLSVPFDQQTKIKSIHGWCIPAQGKDYEVKDKDAIEHSPMDGIITDTKFKVLNIPAAEPGNIVGYEYELEEQPLFLQYTWYFQEADPVKESHFSLQLPAGWEYKVAWLNHPEVKAIEAGNNSWRWTVDNVPEIRQEQEMPPMRGIEGQM